MSSRLWALTAFFNSCGYRSRLSNYRAFRACLHMPLVTVELAFGSAAFALRPGDAEVLVQVRGGDVMWQKERLLNIGLGRLPRECTKVLAVDCDMVVRNARAWPGAVSGLLDTHAVVQPYARLHYLSAAGQPQETRASLTSLAASVGAAQLLREESATGRLRALTGLAWAGRREVLHFFDACIIGGGDTAFACAVHGCPDEVVRLHRMNARQAVYYRAWAAPLKTPVTSADFDVYHLWHGAMVNRQAAARHEGLRRFDFDPVKDLTRLPGEPWRWNTRKPAMHEYVRDFFGARREDDDA